MKPWIIRICIHALAIYGGLCLLAGLFQRRLIYFPTRDIARPVGSTEILKSGDATLVITVRPREGAEALIYFGGNAEEVDANLGPFEEAFPRHALYLMHYRGYDGSSGKPTEAHLHADAQVLYDRVRALHPEITVMGRSLGSGVAVRLAAHNPVKGLILVTPFDSLLNIARRAYPYLPVSLILRDRYDSRRFAPQVKAPTLILAAQKDELVPRESSQALYRAFPPGVALYLEIAGTGHNTIQNQADYVAALRGF